MSISKYCSDYLRQSFQQKTGQKLKASHSRELVAAFFGYKSHAALLATGNDFFFELKNIVEILKPDEELIDLRCRNLEQAPPTLSSFNVINTIANYLVDNKFYEGEFCINQSLDEYISEKYLNDEELDSDIEYFFSQERLSSSDELTSEDIDVYDYDQIDDCITVMRKGKLYVAPSKKHTFSVNGEQLNYTVQIAFRRIGHIGFDLVDYTLILN